MKSILITGGMGGMGLATAKLLEAQGFKVFCLDRKGQSTQENILFIETDVTDEQSVKAAFQKVTAETNELCGILHFAGIYVLDSLIEIGDEQFKKTVDVNLHGVFLINKVFFPLLKRGSKIIVTTSELAPLDPLPFTGLYALTKSALDKYAYSLRMELQLLGIDVSVIRAGAVDTGMLGVSTSQLDRFCEQTKLYSFSAKRFKRIVNSVETRCVPPQKIAEKAAKILKKKNPKFVYNINRNPLLLLLDLLPKGMQLFTIRMILR